MDRETRKIYLKKKVSPQTTKLKEHNIVLFENLVLSIITISNNNKWEMEFQVHIQSFFERFKFLVNSYCVHTIVYL